MQLSSLAFLFLNVGPEIKVITLFDIIEILPFPSTRVDYLEITYRTDEYVFIILDLVLPEALFLPTHTSQTCALKHKQNTAARGMLVTCIVMLARTILYK